VPFVPVERTGTVAGVVLAAGSSTRMGKNKLLFDLDGLAPPCRIVVNPDYVRGINFSLKTGIATLVTRYRTSGAPLVISDYEDVNAPPMLYDRALFQELRAMEGEGCGRQVVRRHRTRAVVVGAG
jgi:CTP:molybdopterin cytidylyltransferase MocA